MPTCGPFPCDKRAGPFTPTSKVVSAGVALFGWEQATGTVPPGIVEERPAI